METVNTELESKMLEFLEKDLFVDFKMQLNNGKVAKAHRIVLAKNSTVFHDFFKSNPNGISDQLYSEMSHFIPDNDAFLSVIKMCYTRKFDANFENIVSILIFSHLFGFTEIMEKSKDYLMSLIAENNPSLSDSIFSLTSPFTKINIDEKANEVFPGITNNLKNIDDVSDILSDYVAGIFYTLDFKNTCKNLTVRMFSNMVKKIAITEEQVEKYHVSSTSEVRVYLLDKFAEGRDLNAKDRDDLASVIDWNLPESNTYFCRFKCDWVPFKIARQKISLVITNRRKTIETVSKDVSELKEPVHSRIGSLQTIQLIAEGKGKGKTEDYDLFDGLTTLWGACSPFDIIKYGIVIPAEGTTKPMTRRFELSNTLFNNNDYYFTTSKYQNEKKIEGSQELKFGYNFTPEGASANTHLNIVNINVCNCKGKKLTVFSINYGNEKKESCVQDNVYKFAGKDASNVEFIAKCPSDIKGTPFYSLRARKVSLLGKAILQ